YITVPFPRRKSAPGVQGILGRMGAAIHPDRHLLFLHINVAMISADLLRGLIDVGPKTDGRAWTLQRIVPSVRSATPLGDIEILRRPALDSQTVALSDGHAGDVTDH